ncbi:DUF484 family protein [Varunaivibrio sulfuroxidans]|uniref:DUF484 family protein n=1 Tax=Varunaivibrio sulfuroxidans TaxID=1773489 RepID=A0A4R3JD40_9PROT|nr:DUF484 family protein [Varunaivibrio sulfuroxidans]TCS63594.1 hypothetical protein EDD55_103217 [Varunaivibrio sulfuroxidans]WES30264.1 DUF484 family protein [Varunaivibrio sulfuroxidans]
MNGEREGQAGVDRGESITEDDVLAYLRKHPHFLSAYPELLVSADIKARWGDGGGGVVDMQQVLLSRLREEIENLSSCAQDVIETSRTNMSHQARTHTAALSLLGADDLEQLARTIAEDLPLILNVDAATIGFELHPNDAERPLSPLFLTSGIGRFGAGYGDETLGGGTSARLISDISDNGALFGPASTLVRSAGVARLNAGAHTPPGILALGSRSVGAFYPGQGTELLGFLARIVERKCEQILRQAA